MKKLILLAIFCLWLACNISYSQNIAITDDNGYSPDQSAMLDVQSTSKGLLIPRLTSLQRTSITNSAAGLLVFDITEDNFYFYNGTNWISLTSETNGIWTENGTYTILTDSTNKVGVGTSTPFGKLEVKADASIAMDEPIFEILNANGDTVFAVYSEGVRVYVSDDPIAKASTSKRGGFIVGGFSQNKSSTNEFLRVTPDSVRIYIDDDFIPSKAVGNRGGFAVGGFSEAKGSVTNDYMFVQDDSTRIWTDNTGGFKIMDLTSNSSNYLDLTPQNYFIGHNSGQSTSTGLQNCFLGYESGFKNTTGSSNTFIGRSGYNNTEGSRNVFIGPLAGKNNISGWDNIMIGVQAGFEHRSGNLNVYIGTNAGSMDSTGSSNTYVGTGAGKLSTGSGNTMVGKTTGAWSSGFGNTYLGTAAGHKCNGSYNLILGYAAGVNRTEGANNVIIGANAAHNTIGSNQLFIENTTDTTHDETNSLIYGEFDNDILRFNGKVGVSREAAANALEVNGEASKTVAGNWLANSDRRIKTDIQEIDDATDIVMNLHPVKFKYTKEWRDRNSSIGDRYYYNYIAQEYQKVFPECVKGSGEYLDEDKDEILQIDTYNAQIIAIKAIQDLIKQNEEHEIQISSLTEYVRKLEADHDKMEQSFNDLKSEVETMRSYLNQTAALKGQLQEIDKPE